MKIITTIVIFLALCMVALILKVAYKLTRERLQYRRLQRESAQIQKREAALKKKGFKKFTFWLPVIKEENGKEVHTRIPRHIYAPDFKTANRQHQEDLKSGKR